MVGHLPSRAVRFVQDCNFVLAVVLEVLTVTQEVAGGHQLSWRTDALRHLLLRPHQPGVEAPEPGLVVGVVLHVDAELVQLGLQLRQQSVDAVPATLESLHELLRISGEFLPFSREYFYLLLLGLNRTRQSTSPLLLSLPTTHLGAGGDPLEEVLHQLHGPGHLLLRVGLVVGALGPAETVQPLLAGPADPVVQLRQDGVEEDELLVEDVQVHQSLVDVLQHVESFPQVDHVNLQLFLFLLENKLLKIRTEHKDGAARHLWGKVGQGFESSLRLIEEFLNLRPQSGRVHDLLAVLHRCSLHVEILLQSFQFGVCGVQNSGALLPLVFKVLPGVQIIIQSIFPFLFLIIGQIPGIFQLVDLKQQNYWKIINFR